ncbi:catalase-domain-containing protein [Cytidiella melzeri]|nr:catalase-domain-containing protein [Cytidiella melzeri]
MRFNRQRLLPFVIIVCSVFAIEALANVQNLARDTAAPGSQAFSFNVEYGSDMQVATSKEPATAMEFTTDGGVPHSNPYDYQRIGSNGPLLMQDVRLVETLAHFVRERIPERVVHAKGAGAHGYFEATNADFVKQYSIVDAFTTNGLKTPLTVRFSTVGGESGSADSARDPRGFAIKLRTRQGILDLVMNNTPVFFLRDPAKFPHFIHTQKRNPQTHLHDADLFWDYLGSNPESLYQAMRLFSDLGTPYGLRHMNGWTGHTYRFVKADGTWSYVKLYAETMQGVQNFTAAEATALAGSNADFATQDLFEAIDSGDYPGWTVYAQVLSPQQAETFKYNVLDLTKDWGFDDVNKTEIGRFYLTENPTNYFAEIEQAAFSPGRTVPGWEPSADPVLQSRLFSYGDAHRYRLGANNLQIPVNAPTVPVANFVRDGAMTVNGNQGSRPNYHSTLEKIQMPPMYYIQDTHQQWEGGAVQSLSQVTAVDFDWPRRFWTSLSAQDQKNLIRNIIGHLGNAKSVSVKQRQVALFSLVDAAFGSAVAAGVNVAVPNPLPSFPAGPTWLNTTFPSGNSTLNY